MPISKISFIRSTVLALFVGLAALLLIVGVSLWLVGQTRMYSDTVTNARFQRTSIVDLRTMLADAETGQRGFLLTGNPTYLEPYQNATSKLADQLEKVRDLTANDPSQKAVVDRLSPIVRDKLAELKQTIDLWNTDRHAEALAVVATNRGKAFMDEARKIFDDMIADAERKIDAAVEDQQESISALRWVTIGGALVIILVVGGAVWAVLLYTKQLVEAEREVQSLNAGLEVRVQERTADLGRANEEIQRFAYIVTHDLRAPLVNIMGFTSELEGSLTPIKAYIDRSNEASDDAVVKDARTAVTEDLPEAIGFIRSSTHKMDALINAILKLSREGRRVLKPEPIELESLLKTAAANVQHQVGEAGGDVSFEGYVPPVVSDRLALEQVFGNLFDNAIKYRAPNRPLHIKVRTREDFGQRIVVEVEDNGRGIAKQDHERVFDLFRRSGAQDQPGEGIGLAHVRSVMRNLGGDISLQSEPERGTTMTLSLPRDLRRIIGAT
jgi:CHASE3 domain sensor protein/two-component sensor histidine kinase